MIESIKQLFEFLKLEPLKQIIAILLISLIAQSWFFYQANLEYKKTYSETTKNLILEFSKDRNHLVLLNEMEVDSLRKKCKNKIEALIIKCDHERDSVLYFGLLKYKKQVNENSQKLMEYNIEIVLLNEKLKKLAK